MRTIYKPATLQKDLILEALQKAPNGLTYNELIKTRGIRWTAVGTTVRKMEIAGLVYDAGTEQRGNEGRKATVWKMK